ncbi:GGDEF domain-containing protein [Ectothiorhodospira marina]|uniref:diguanylate cyclase n=1 Tax=Ectothiorhodospira marina TaxID=1396821 RepID=A0A1H7IHJ4_9GAMM|nr:GGDEF domain-containing protein [Ectothiorhodospira marina]SEK61784.1 diguanylate cyclase (GGDEF) domain-containing protein [Ectothiorhodospira marina]
MRHVIRPMLEQANNGDNTLMAGPQLLQGGLAQSERHAPSVPAITPAMMLHRLQTTLDLEELLEIFANAVAGMVPHDGLTFDQPDMGIHISRGRLSRHVCSYNLMVERTEIGQIRLLRGRKFKESELIALEEALSALTYPLRNALLYHQALTSAQTDPLTGLLNRISMTRMVDRELAMAARSGRQVCMLVVDVDLFKRVNDTHGHQAGDHVLVAVAERLSALTRKSDMVFRYGGEEFVIVLSETDAESAATAAGRVQEVIRSAPLTLDAGEQIWITASIGVALQHPDDSPASLFKRADQAMYRAKHGGRDRIEWAD